MIQVRILPRWLLISVFLFLALLLLLVSCYRIVRPEENMISSSTNPNPIPITGILVARGGAMAEWSTTTVKPQFGLHSAKLQIPPGGPPMVPYAYVGIESPVVTVSEIERIEAQYFIPSHVISDFRPYIVICLDLDGDGSGCDDFIIGDESDKTPKNQWNTINTTKWRIVSEGWTEYTLEELRSHLGNQSVIRVRVSVGMWDTAEGLVAYIDALTVNNVIYNLEPRVSSE